MTALAIGVLGAVPIGFLIAAGRVDLAIAAAAFLPLAALVVRDPFAGLMLWVLLLPFFVNLSSQTGPVLWALHRLGIPGAIILTAVHARLGWRRWGLHIGWIDICLAAFIGIGLANVVFLAQNPIRMTAAFYDMLVVPIMLFWLIRAVAPRSREVWLLVLAGGFTMFVQSTIGTLSWLAPSVLPAAWLGRAGERTTGTLGGPAPFTVTLVLFALLAVHAAAQSSGRGKQLVLVGLTVFASLAIFLSLSRGSWLGAGAALLGLALVYRRVFVYVALIGAVGFVALSVGPLAEQYAFAQERLSDVETVESRVITNDASLRMIAARPLTGFGFGNFELYDESFKQRVGDIPLKLGGSSHNTYLNLLAELGIPATILYLLPVLILGVRTIIRWRWLPAMGLVSRPLVLVLWLSIVDQIIVLNFLEMIHPYYWATSLWWLALGLIATTLDQAVPRSASVMSASGAARASPWVEPRMARAPW